MNVPFSNEDTKKSDSKGIDSLRVTQLLSVGTGFEPKLILKFAQVAHFLLTPMTLSVLQKFPLCKMSDILNPAPCHLQST